jgi:beta-galactosidase
MLFGASYYHEYQPYERLDEDIRMMREAHINYARLGDSIWALCEPDEGRFELDWLQRILDGLHGGGIKVILCTPTYAIPPWLARLHPEVMARYGLDNVARYGGRQNMNFTDPTYLSYAERIIRRLLDRYGRHPAVIGFQVDNETGTGMLHNRNVIERFRRHLREKYESVDSLNEIWGLNYWSHRLGDWHDLWPPQGISRHGTGASGNTNPGYDLEWRRFQARLTTEFIAWQVALVKEYAGPDQFVTQDVVGGYGRGDSDSYQIGQAVDVLAMNSQHPTQGGLDLSGEEQAPPPQGHWQEEGVSLLYFKSDLAWSARRSNFLVTESNPISVGGSVPTFPAYDGQWRQAAYAYISRGSNMVAYWHWHSLHYGHEIYSHGILNHDLEPNRCYRELSRIGAELCRHEEVLTDLRPDADVAFLYSQDSRYGLEFQPCLIRPGATIVEADSRSYQRIFNAFYQGFFDARAQAAMVHPPQEFEGFPVLVAPALYIADDALLERLVRYSEAGGHLVLSFRSGYADEYARARWQRAPGPLRQAVGASYNDYSNLAYPLPLNRIAHGLVLPPEARISGWVDGLELEGAEALAFYDHPHFGRYPAIVSQAFGRGRVTYVGGLPNAAAAEALGNWVLNKSGISVPGVSLPRVIRITSARASRGERLWFFHNWSGRAEVASSLPVGGKELFRDVKVAAGGELELGPWDVKVVVES